MALLRWRVVLNAAWLGAMLGVALLGTTSAFALLPQAEAGRVAGRMLALEAQMSLVLGVITLLLERQVARRRAAAEGASIFSAGMVLALGAMFCTVAGHYGLQPMMAAARAGQSRLGFGALHTLSVAFYVLKAGLVAALAWRASVLPKPT